MYKLIQPSDFDNCIKVGNRLILKNLIPNFSGFYYNKFESWQKVVFEFSGKTEESKYEELIVTILK